MTTVIFLTFRTFFITIMTVGMMASLTEFRFGCKKLLCILAIYSVWVFGSSVFLLWVGGELLLLRIFFFTISIPATLLIYWTANDTPAQAVFNYTTQIMVSALSASLIRWITELFHLSQWVNMLMMALFYFAVIYLEWRFLRRPFRMLMQVIPTRWGVLTLIPCVFCAYLIFVSSWPGSYLENTSQRMYLYAAIFPIAVVYISVFKSLIGQYRVQMEQQRAVLLTMQISALKEKLQKVEEVEEGIRIQRHDLRHRLQVAGELVARGERQSAMDFLSAAMDRLDSYQAVHWCHPPVLDAVFASYFDQARRQEIQVDAKISLPDKLPVDEGELAIIFANALENAIHANLELPQEQRLIRCRVIGSPNIMLEIVNPFVTAVGFDDKGFPTAGKEGHGLGTQSVRFFCEKYGAVCQYEAKDGLFSFRVIL
jgi:hypothetical protein